MLYASLIYDLTVLISFWEIEFNQNLPKMLWIPVDMLANLDLDSLCIELINYPDVCFLLDSFIAEQKLPLGANKGKLQKLYPEMGNSVVLPDEVITSDIDGVDVYGTGLRNEVGEYNCFLNVIIQVCTRESILNYTTFIYILVEVKA